MPTSKDLLKQAVQKKSKAELVTWVLDRAESSEDERRAVLAWASPQADTTDLAKDIRKQITATWSKVKRSRSPHRMASTVAGELEPVLTTIEAIIERGDAKQAEALLRRFLEAADSAVEHIDDSYGRLWPVLQHGVTLWGKAWAKLVPKALDPLVTLVLDGVFNNSFAIRDRMIEDFAEALGESGLRMLEQRLCEQHKLDAKDSTLSEWDRNRALHHLATVADALNDVDLYIDAHTLADNQSIYALPIARRLLDTDRAEEALKWLETIGDEWHKQSFQGEEQDAQSLRIRALKALGRHQEARDGLWAQFEKTLDSTALESLIEDTPEKDRQNLRDHALKTAEQHRSPVTAAFFFLRQDEKGRAANLVTKHPDRFPGSHYEQLIHLTEAFDESHPAAAWWLYRNLMTDILESSRYKAYPHAARYLVRTRTLADTTGLVDLQSELEDLLQAKHQRKTSFWKHVEANTD